MQPRFLSCEKTNTPTLPVIPLGSPTADNSPLYCILPLFFPLLDNRSKPADSLGLSPSFSPRSPKTRNLHVQAEHSIPMLRLSIWINHHLSRTCYGVLPFSVHHVGSLRRFRTTVVIVHCGSRFSGVSGIQWVPGPTPIAVTEN